MATTDRFSPAQATAVANQLAAFFAASPGTEGATLAPSPTRDLTESLAVCFLGVQQVRHPPVDLSQIWRPKGVWHHQIRTTGIASHVARSNSTGFEDSATIEVQQLAESPVAQKIDRALAWADLNVTGRATVRLLIAPAYCLHALLIIRGDACSALLVDQPVEYSRLSFEREWPLAEFLRALAKERPATSFAG